MEYLVYQFCLALAEALLQKTPHFSLVLFRHRGLLSPLLLSVVEPYPAPGEAKTKWSKGQGANFGEPCIGEVPRIHLLGTWVNRGVSQEPMSERPYAQRTMLMMTAGHMTEKSPLEKSASITPSSIS